MAFEDQVLTRFTADASQLNSAFDIIIQNSKKVATALGVVSKTSSSTAASTTKLATASRGAATGLKATTSAALSTQTVMASLERQTGNMSRSFRQSTMSLSTGSAAMDMFSMRVDRASLMMWRFTMAAIPMRELGLITGTVAAGAVAMGVKITQAAGMVDRVTRQFTLMTGSLEKGSAAVDYMREQAPKIRYTLEQVLEAGRVLQTAGYDVRTLLYPMADLAAGVGQAGIDIEQASRAFVDAMHGEFRRLRNTFDITRQEVEAFSDSAMNAMGQVVDREQMQMALMAAIEAKYGGQNKATMATIEGQWSNFNDQVFQATAVLGDHFMPIALDALNRASSAVKKFTDLVQGDFGKAMATFIKVTAIAFGGIAIVAGLASITLTITGLIATLKVFKATYTTSLQSIISAELQLAAIQREMARLTAERTSGDIASLQVKLAYLQKEADLRAAIAANIEAEAGNDAAAIVTTRGARSAASDSFSQAKDAVELNDIARTRIDLAMEELAVRQSADELRTQAKNNWSTMTNDEIKAMHAAEEEERFRLVAIREENEALIERKALLEGRAITPVATQSAAAGVATAQADVSALNAKTNQAIQQRNLLQGELKLLLSHENSLLAAGAATNQAQLTTTREKILAKKGEIATNELLEASLARQLAAARAILVAERERAIAAGASGVAVSFQQGVRTGFDLLTGGIELVFKPFFDIIEKVVLAFKTLSAGGIAAVAGALLVFAAAIVVVLGAVALLVKSKEYERQATENLAKMMERAAETFDESSKTHGFSEVETQEYKKIKTASDLAAKVKVHTVLDWKGIKSGTLEMLQPYQDAIAKGATPEDAKTFVAAVIDEIGHGKAITNEQAIEYGLVGGWQGKTASSVETMTASQLSELSINYNLRGGKSGGADLILQGVQGRMDEYIASHKGVNDKSQKIARDWITEQLASGDLNDNTKEYYENLKMSATPAYEVAEIISDNAKTRLEDLGTAKKMGEEIENELAAGKDMGTVLRVNQSQLEEEKKTVAEVRKERDRLAKIAPKYGKELSDIIDKSETELKLQQDLLDVTEARYELIRANEQESLLGASGAKSGPDVFADRKIAAEMKYAKAEFGKNTEEGRAAGAAHVTNAYKIRSQQIGAETSAGIAMTELGPGATDAQKVEQAKKRAYIYGEEYARKEALWGHLTAELRRQGVSATELENINRTKAIDLAATESNIEQSKYDAQKIALEAREKLLKSNLALYSEMGYSAAELHDINIAILQTQKALAVIDGKSTARIDDATAKLAEEKSKRESILSTAEAQLSLMETMNKKGLMSDSAVESAKNRISGMYKFMASKAKTGSAEQANWLQKSLDVLGDKTSDDWDGIIGKILGAPQQLVEELMSEGRMTQMFGPLDRFVGNNRNAIGQSTMQQTRREMTYKIKLDDNLAVQLDARMDAAVQRGMTQMAKYMKEALA